MKRSRIGISEDSEFTADEIEVAGTITYFRHYWRLFLQWGSKRRRSTLQRDKSSATHNSKLLHRRDDSPLYISARENGYELEHGLQPISCPNAKNVKAKNQPRKKAPKKKKHRELTETVVELTLENARLIKEVEKMSKTNQYLKNCNANMKSQVRSPIWVFDPLFCLQTADKDIHFF